MDTLETYWTIIYAVCEAAAKFYVSLNLLIPKEGCRT
jgi:hypothetical protein